MRRAAPTLAELTPEQRTLLEARLRRRRQARGDEVVARRIARRRAGSGPPPLSFAQRRLWLLDRLEAVGPSYNIAAGIRLTGELAVPALAGALAAVEARHEVLRAGFEEGPGAAGAGEPVQRLGSPRRGPLPFVNLAGLPPGRLDTEANRCAETLARRPFDLALGGLLRAALVATAAAPSGKTRHLLVLVMHHAVADGGSVEVLLREVGVLYTAGLSAQAGGRAGAASSALSGMGLPGLELPALEIQYGDYAAWERRQVAEEPGRWDEQLAYWRQRLGEDRSPLDLPVDRSRPARRGSAGGREVSLLPADLMARLRELALGRSATPYMLLLAAFQALLARLSGAEGVRVGTPVDLRDGETEGLIGFFVNTVVVDVELGDDPPFVTLLERTREAVLAAHAHQEVPYDRVVEAVSSTAAERSLFQAAFELQGAALAGGALPGLEMELLELDTGTAKFDLTLFVRQGAPAGRGEPAPWRAAMEYHADLFRPATARRLLHRYEVLLEGIAADPERRVSELPLLRPAERRQLVEEWSGRATAYPSDASIPGLVAAQAAATPEAVAVEWGEERLSYRELVTSAARLAGRLRDLGVGRGTRVALAVERSPALVVAMLATGWAGAAYVPLDPASPRRRQEMILEDTGAPVVIGHRPLLADLPLEGRHAVMVDRLGSVLVEGEPSAGSPALGLEPPVDLGGDDLSYVLYTSGSTGRPKGVAVPHKAIARLVLETDYVRLSSGDRVAQAASAAFDAATFEIWGPLVHGGTVVGIERDDLLSPRALAAALAERRVSVLFLTTALFHQVAREAPSAFGPLDTVMFGGEAVDPRWVRAVLAEGGPRRLLHVYGPTESTTFATWHPVTAVAVGARTVPIGGALANTRVYVVDEAGEPAPVGMAGELVLGGDGLARGYAGDPARTAARFQPDPFSHRPGDRLYRTGDLVRWVTGEGDEASEVGEPGVLEFIGRRDHQVKLRGFRIELGEIESALAAHPEVAEAVVVAREDGPGRRRLVGYAAAAEGAVEEAELRSWLAERVPDYMVPPELVRLDALPLNRNGKVDRAALPEPSQPEADAGRAPAGPLEEAVAAVWGEVLGVEAVAAKDDFFALGGHSLLVTQVATRLRQELDLDVPLRTVFENPTVAQLAAALRQLADGGRELAGLEPGDVRLDAGTADPATHLPPVRPLRRRGPSPLSFGQRRIWLAHQFAPDHLLDNVPNRIHVRGRLSIPSLVSAFAAVVRRHEVLRTRFSVVGGEPGQVVEEPWVPRLPGVDLTALAAGLGEEEARRLATAESRRPFDLRQARPLRARLLRLGADDFHLLLTLHHVASDGRSVEVLVREMGVLYTAALEGRPSPLAELPVQYADYAAWQRRHLTSEALTTEMAFWRRELAGLEPLDLPTDRASRKRRERNGAQIALRLDAELSLRLEEVARQRGATPFMALSTAFLALLSRWTGQADVSLGTPVSGRYQPELQGLIGFFVNTLVLRADLSGTPSFVEALERVRRAAIGAVSHPNVPFERLVEELASERSSGSENPLFRVFHSYHADPSAGLRVPNLELSVERVERGTSTFDLSLVWSRDEEGLAGVLEYATGLFEESTLSRFRGWLHSLLQGAVEEPHRALAEFSLLSTTEVQQVRCDWQGGDRDLPIPASLALAFREAAAAYPASVAVVDEVERLTYRQLDERSDRLARCLVERGVGPEVPVGILLERSAAMLVAMVAVVKAGGAYLPLDPTYPEERLSLMLQDADAPVLISSPQMMPSFDSGTVSRLPPDAEPENGDTPLPAVLGDSAAYVIYTSGSTGSPKGVVVGQGAVLRLLAATRRWFDFSHDDVWSLFSSIAFDFSVWEIWGCLLHGGRLVVVPYWVSRSPERFLDLLQREAVTVLNQTPSAFRQLAEADRRRQPPADLALRTVIFGGEALDFASLADWFERRGDAVPRLINMYGITETTVHTTYRRVTAEESRGGALSRIGWPLPDLRTYLLDDGLEIVPPGAVGELHVGGDGLARGYLGRPRLTAQRFVPDPYAERPGQRLYRSGDLGRYGPEGDLAYVGRADQQVKIRGHRIELGEVESVLATHPGVRAAAALGLPARVGGGLELVGYVVPAEPLPEAARREWLAALRADLGKRLPAPMVPSALIPVAELPLGPTGKLNRRALPRPDAALDGTDAGYVAPRNPVEERLAAIWRQCLGAGKVGMADDFFELGGHSLVLTRVASRLGEEFAVDLPLRTLFNAPTLDDVGVALARHLAHRMADAAGLEAARQAVSAVQDLSPADLRHALEPAS